MSDDGDGPSHDAHAGEQAVRGIRTLIDAALRRLQQERVPAEALAEYRPQRRRWGLFRVASRMQPIDRVWRLGVFLLTADGRLLTAGHSTRSVVPGHPGHHSLSAEQRREYRAAAQRGGIPDGETVHFDAEEIAVDAASLTETRGPLFIRDGVALVRWSRGVSDADARRFAEYLPERIDLLLHPPEGA